MLPRLTAWVRGRIGARTRRPYDIAVVHQWLLLTLQRYGECSFSRLEGELAAIRGASPARVVEALLELETLALIAPAAAAGLMQEERRFVLTPTGRKVAAFVPPTPRSATIFYV